MASQPKSWAEVHERIGPLAPIGLRDRSVSVTITRTISLPGIGATVWVEQREWGADLQSAEVRRARKLGVKMHGDRVFTRSQSGEWSEVRPLAPYAGPVAAPAAELDPVVEWHGANAVRVIWDRGGAKEEWEIDWASRVVTGCRWIAADGRVMWEESRQEEVQNGLRWTLHVERRDHSGWGMDFTEEWTWVR